MVKSCEMRPIDGRKSFYGKARALYHEASRSWMLMSYDTIVAMYYTESHLFIRRWNGYSATTMRHVNAFLAFLGYDPRNKAWWTALPMFTGVSLGG